jgi:hypothetical protein
MSFLFSPRYASYKDWLENFRGSESYKNRIIRLHSKYPNATLSQLRGHPKAREKEVSKLKEKPIYKRSWNELTDRERVLRKNHLMS